MSGYVFVLITVALTVYGQLVIKWQVGKVGAFPADMSGRVEFFVRLFTNPWVISSLIMAVLAALTYMIALSKLDLSRAYPVMSLSFVGVVLLSGLLFSESITPLTIGGLALIMLGVYVGAQSL